MTSIYLDVPFQSQLKLGDPDNPINDVTGCWYASACMIGYYFEVGPRLGVPEKYDPVKQRHSIMMNEDYPKLMANEGLALVPLPTGKQWGGDQLADLLRDYGPLSFGWMKTSKRSGKTYGHRSVLIGYDDTTSEVIFHDPELLPNSRLPLATFNKVFRWVNPYGMLRRDGPALVRPTQ
ncbi:MAG: papain-like cysteine protease family protein [Sphingomonas sp.]